MGHYLTNAKDLAMNPSANHAAQKIAAIAGCFSPQKMRAAKVSNMQVASLRSIRFDLPDGAAKDGINRVKVTNVDGTFRVQFLKVEEVDLIGGVAPDELTHVIRQFTGVEL
jgi:hypothetical protein